MISWRFIFQKLIHLILVFIGVSIVTFCISHVIPGDPARMLVGPHASPETLEAARQSLGLDKPVLTQYALYMEGLAHGIWAFPSAPRCPCPANWPAISLPPWN